MGYDKADIREFAKSSIDALRDFKFDERDELGGVSFIHLLPTLPKFLDFVPRTYGMIVVVVAYRAVTFKT